MPLCNGKLICPASVLTFTALSQIVLYLWVTDRIGTATALAALIGIVVFGLLVRAVRDIFAEYEFE